MALDLFVQDDNNFILDVPANDSDLHVGQPVVKQMVNNYEELTNKPSINEVELVGNKTFEDLGLVPATSEHDGLMSAEDKAALDAIPSEIENIYEELNDKQDELTFDSTPTQGSSNPVTSNGIYEFYENKPYLKCVGYWYLLTPAQNHATLEIVNGTSLDEALKQPVQVYISMNDYPTPDYIGQSLLQINDYEDDYIVVFPQSIQWAAFLTKIKCGGAKFRYNSSTHLFTFKSLIEGTELKENKVQRIPEVDIDYDYASDQYPSIRAIRKMFDDLHMKMQMKSSSTKTLADLELDENGDLIPTFYGVSFPVQSVNGKTGTVSLGASDVGALPDTTPIPTKTSDLTNDSEFISESAVDTKLSTKADSAGASANYAAKLTAGIPYGELDSTSTATIMTATVPGITELKNGVCMMLKNGVITSAANFTININGLGAKPVYQTMAAASRITTTFNVAYTMLFTYNEDRVDGGCWDMYYGYYTNTNTIGYQLRTNSSRLSAADQTGRYRLLFMSADNTHWVPGNTSSSTSATTAKTVNQRPIDPFGAIRYYGYTTVIAAESMPGAAYMWQQYVVTLGYTFTPITLNDFVPVYLKCAPQANSSAIIDSTTPVVQALPSTNDGFIYIYLGIATSTTAFELSVEHPVLYHDGTGIKLWTGVKQIPNPPSTDGTYTLQCTVSSGVATYSWI